MTEPRAPGSTAGTASYRSLLALHWPLSAWCTNTVPVSLRSDNSEHARGRQPPPPKLLDSAVRVPRHMLGAAAASTRGASPCHAVAAGGSPPAARAHGILERSSRLH